MLCLCHLPRNFLLFFPDHMRYICARTALPIPTPSSAIRIGLGGAMACEESLRMFVATTHSGEQVKN
jgi:hypothetical protein